MLDGRVCLILLRLFFFLEENQSKLALFVCIGNLVFVILQGFLEVGLSSNLHSCVKVCVCFVVIFIIDWTPKAAIMRVYNVFV